MNSRLSIGVIAGFLFASSCANLQARSEVCDGKVVFLENREFTVNQNAEKLICGDQKLSSWKEIPASQKKLMITGLLKTEAFHHPSFTEKDGRLLVDPGVKSRVHKVEFLHVPDEFFDYKPPQFQGRLLTPETLDDIEKWANRRLHEIGYPCARIETLASTEDETVLINVKAGAKRVFPTVLDHSKDELPRAVEARYRAFFPGDPYRYSLLKLSSTRMEMDGIASRSVYAEECEETPLPLVSREIPIAHRSSLGPPRSLQIGFGFSTEEYFLTRASWKNTRLGSQASLLGVTLSASFISQELSLYSNQYLSKAHPRIYLAPKLSFEHRNEPNQEYNRSSLPLFIGWSHDYRLGALEAELGPKLTLENDIRGPTTGRKRLILADSRWDYKSHTFEINRGLPSEGFQTILQTSSVVHSFEAPANASKVRVEGTWLLNLGRVDPARWVLGFRGKIQTLIRDRRPSTLDQMPLDYFTWLGGEDDLRGFGRKELPFDRNGTLSSAYLGTELRAPIYFGDSLDPLIFFDSGFLGSDSEFRLDSHFFYSPGIGLRWQSPIGTVRSTLAHGFMTSAKPEDDKYQHFQIFISLGREF